MKYDLPSFGTPPPSSALKQFLFHWFENSMALTRGEADLEFLAELKDDERAYACDLLRRNLRLRYTHIIEGLAALRDVSAIPVLRRMLDEEPDLSRRLTIAGSLWRLGRDEVFVDLLGQMKSSENATLRQAHFDQVLWLADERAIDLLCGFLDDSDSFVRYLALSSLNEIEFHGQLTIRRAADLPRQPADYLGRRYDTAFRKMMVDKLAKVLKRRFPVL